MCLYKCIHIKPTDLVEFWNSVTQASTLVPVDMLQLSTLHSCCWETFGVLVLNLYDYEKKRRND